MPVRPDCWARRRLLRALPMTCPPWKCGGDIRCPRQLGVFWWIKAKQRHPMLPPEYVFVEMRQVDDMLTPRDCRTGREGKADFWAWGK